MKAGRPSKHPNYHILYEKNIKIFMKHEVSSLNKKFHGWKKVKEVDRLFIVIVTKRGYIYIYIYKIQ